MVLVEPSAMEHERHDQQLRRIARPAREAEQGAGTSQRVRGARRVLLASRSPRRRELLAQHDIAHEAIHPGVDDSGFVPGNVSPEQWVTALAYLKARAGADVLSQKLEAGRAGVDGPGSGIGDLAQDAVRAQDYFVLGADTTCVLEGRSLGTPVDADEARAMLEAFRGKAHEVITGVAILDLATGKRHLFADRATVTLGDLSGPEIDEYVASKDWQGKAGAYNLSERLKAGWPLSFEGEPSTIMGLPIKLVVAKLRSLGVD
ncbi:MAG: Maf family protein [Planctomycetota bacterium]|nr:Maf family protein [Planctomycetota bacterium]